MNDFYLASLPEPVTLLGLRLRPFSLGHKLLLHRVESAFVCGGEITFSDLALSVFICSQTYWDACASFNNRHLQQFMARWHAKLTGDLWWRRWLRRPVHLINLKEKAEAFARYLEDGSRLPYYEVPADRTGESSIETVHAVQLTLMSKTTLTEAELLDRSWGRCLFDYIALLAMEDRLKIFENKAGEQRRDAIAEAQEIANKIAAKLNRQCNGSILPNS